MQMALPRDRRDLISIANNLKAHENHASNLRRENPQQIDNFKLQIFPQALRKWTRSKFSIRRTSDINTQGTTQSRDAPPSEPIPFCALCRDLKLPFNSHIDLRSLVLTSNGGCASCELLRTILEPHASTDFRSDGPTTYFHVMLTDSGLFFQVNKPMIVGDDKLWLKVCALQGMPYF